MKYRFLIVFLAVALSACSQNDAITSSVATTHNHHAPNHHAPTSSSHTAPHIVAYQQSMNAMHKDMMTASQISNPDRAFALGMIPHHQGAVEMAKIQLQYGKNAEMRQLAQAILQNQQPEIDFMQNWLKNAPTHNPVKNQHSAEYAQMAWHDAMMQGIQAENPDRAFALGMIPHHQGVVQMAQIELKYGTDPKMRQLAQAIIQAQEPEIKQMQNWLSQNPK